MLQNSSRDLLHAPARGSVPCSGIITGMQMHTAPDLVIFAVDVATSYRPSPYILCAILHSRILPYAS
jgi:hypothetical protein